MRLDHLLSKSESRDCFTVEWSRLRSATRELRSLVTRHAPLAVFEMKPGRNIRFASLPSNPSRFLMLTRYFWWHCGCGKHPFPSRTRRLSHSRPMILVWRRTGKVGGRRGLFRKEDFAEQSGTDKTVRECTLKISY